MRKPWSLSTTVREASRLRPFLRVLKMMEGESFDEAGQVKYQTLLIQHKLYEPEGLDAEKTGYYGGDPSTPMEPSQARDIFQHMLDRSETLRESPGLRGRTSVAPLAKLGFCRARQSGGSVQITELGEKLLSEDYDIGQVFFRLFIKWQYPNPDDHSLTTANGYCIRPFIGTLHLISEVNRLWSEEGRVVKGLSKVEFALFVPTLIHYEKISEQAERVIGFRKKLDELDGQDEKNNFIQEYSRTIAAGFLETSDDDEITKGVDTLLDYGDNTIRYFRLTRYLYIRGSGNYIDLEPRRAVEIRQLLEAFSGEPEQFEDADSYFAYLGDVNEPQLPWENEQNLREICIELDNEISALHGYLVEMGIPNLPAYTPSNCTALSHEQLISCPDTLRSIRRRLQEAEDYFKSQSVQAVEDYISKLQNIFRYSGKRSLELEKLAALSLDALNDAITIKPNYPVGDDNEPIFTAPGGVPDIECFYSNFNVVCEVTLLTSRDQWYNEGQPVMRHVRDFEAANPEHETFCLFIAPSIHRDTLNTFWTSVRYGYEGPVQRIIPITISQFVLILKALVVVKRSGRSLRNTDLRNLYTTLYGASGQAGTAMDWTGQFPALIADWTNSLSVQI